MQRWDGKEVLLLDEAFVVFTSLQAFVVVMWNEEEMARLRFESRVRRKEISR